MSIQTRNILGNSIPKLHTKQRKVLGSKLVRRVNPTRLLKSKVPSMCRPPSKPPDRQNDLDVKARKGELLKFTMPGKKQQITGFLPHSLHRFVI